MISSIHYGLIMVYLTGTFPEPKIDQDVVDSSVKVCKERYKTDVKSVTKVRMPPDRHYEVICGEREEKDDATEE